MRRRTLLWLFALTGWLPGAAQDSDSALVQASINQAIARYKAVIGVQARLYNGRKYAPPEQDFDQHPYFLSEDWIIGDVFYDGELFRQVPLMYDIFGRTLITEHLSSGQPIELVTEKLRHFTIDGHHFKRMEIAAPGNGLPRTDFYDVLYEGPTRLLALREKQQKREIDASTIEIVYDERTRYFLYHNGTFTQVKGKASTWKVLQDKKAALKRFAKQNRAAFAPDKELLLKALATHYDTLK